MIVAYPSLNAVAGKGGADFIYVLYNCVARSVIICRNLLVLGVTRGPTTRYYHDTILS